MRNGDRPVSFVTVKTDGSSGERIRSNRSFICAHHPRLQDHYWLLFCHKECILRAANYGVAMRILSVRHITTYRYKQPVGFGEHRMMLCPRDDHDQRLLELD